MRACACVRRWVGVWMVRDLASVVSMWRYFKTSNEEGQKEYFANVLIARKRRRAVWRSGAVVLPLRQNIRVEVPRSE